MGVIQFIADFRNYRNTIRLLIVTFIFHILLFDAVTDINVKIYCCLDAVTDINVKNVIQGFQLLLMQNGGEINERSFNVTYKTEQ